MTRKRTTLKPPRRGYARNRLKRGILYLWNRVAVAVAVRLILVLYSLVRFLLEKSSTE